MNAQYWYYRLFKLMPWRRRELPISQVRAAYAPGFVFEPFGGSASALRAKKSAPEMNPEAQTKQWRVNS